MAQKKTKKRINNRMKKTIRFTIGGLLVVSAIIIALIPQNKILADPETPRVTVSDAESSIPVVKPTDTIYTTGDGMFQFAYIEKSSGGDKVAVIVGYDYERSLGDGELVIPDTVDAYVKYTHAQGTSGGYVAVGKDGNILYYPVYSYSQQQNGVDENGEPIMEEVKTLLRYDPCLYSTYDSWYYEDDGVTVRAPKDYYYEDSSSPEGFSKTNLEINQRIQNASVAYISSQHVVKNSNGDWVLDPTPNVGIFSKATNIQTLKTGSNLLGIGNFAFYECASLRGIDLDDGVNMIGNYAFANCVNLQYANLKSNSSIKALGDHAFFNCRSIKSFNMPVAVQKIGDSAFEGCTGMEEIILNPSDQQVLLSTIGDDVFKNCSNLQYLDFPESISSSFDISWIEGCKSLNFIRVNNIAMKFVANDTLSFSDLLTQLPAEFYFEADENADMHEISTQNNFAFKYLDKEIYEKVNVATGSQGSGKTVFRIDNNNVLTYFYMDKTVEEVILPRTIGPYKIQKIGSDSFRGNHNLRKITIPSSILEIEANAFSGCHNLRDVIFEEPVNLQTIGNGAFNTQLVDPVFDSCALESAPVLTFTGSAEKGSVPFEYAMNPANNINKGSQQLSYITFYTGWPSNLTIQYNPKTDKNELIDYPAGLEQLGTKFTMAQYPYISHDEENAASMAYYNYINGLPLSQDESDIISSALNITIPSGVESVKEGLFSGVTSDGTKIGIPNTSLQTVTLNGCQKIVPHMFEGCTGLIGAYIGENTQVLGDYAFKDCTKLMDVEVSPNLNSIGNAPFIGCSGLQDVAFPGNNNFVCSDAIIYATVSGNKTKLLEILPSRGMTYGTGAIKSDEVAGLQEVAPEASKGCPGVLSIDFTDTTISEIPESCFEDTESLYSVVLPDTCRSINENAFKNSNIRYLEIPTSVGYLDNSAFEDDDQMITFYCEPDCSASVFADKFDNIIVSQKPITYKVTFCDEDGTVLDTVTVNAGADATTLAEPKKEGYKFKAWLPAPLGVTEDMTTYATYSEFTVTYKVRFLDYDDSVISEQEVAEGETPFLPHDPERPGYDFVGWRPSYENITKDTDVYAQYEKIVEKPDDDSGSQKPDEDNGSEKPDKDSNSEKPSEDTNKPGTDTNKPDNDSTNNNGNNGNNGTDKTLYTLTVINGSGGGSYVAGATVILLADNPSDGMVFDKWVTESSGVSFAGNTVAATTIIMPAGNAKVEATYKKAPSSGSNNNAPNNSGNGNNNGSNAGNSSNTTVTVDKNIWNENDVTASVSGSTDNFVLKITDSAYAKSEIEEALKAEYGSLDDLKYFCMDISLYDSTGTKKVANTDDLKVNITMPIPNDLVKYAGNNKIAHVVNGKLVPLNPKFTTINGVPCMTFVANHFSPYTIYVDTTNLSAGTIIDSTPQTGDILAPKWFVSIGMLALAVFLFVKKDKKRIKA